MKQRNLLRIAQKAMFIGLLAAFAMPAQAEKVMKIGLAVADSHIQGVGSRAFKAFIEEKSNGEIKVEIYPAAQLGDSRAMLDTVKIGAVHGIFPSIADLGNISRDYNMLNFPFLFPSQEVANVVMDGPWGQKMLDQLDRYGYKGLAIVDAGFRHTTNRVRPIASLDDFQGLKIRMQPNPMHLDIFKALGANPAPMAFSELFSALQQGVMDGQENPLSNIYASKLHEAQKYLTLDGHIYDTNVFLVGKNYYNSLSAEEQQWVEEGSRLIAKVMREALQEKDAQALEGMKQAGIEVTEVTPEFRMELIKATQPVVDKYVANVNRELYDSLMQEIEKASAQ